MPDELQDKEIPTPLDDQINEQLEAIKNPVERRTLAGLLRQLSKLPLEHTRAAVETSYVLLPPALQRFFARLAVFRGGCILEAAAAVCDDPGAGVGVLGADRANRSRRTQRLFR